MPKKFTQEDFLQKLSEKNIYYKNGDFKVISDFSGWNTKILIKDGFGIILLTPDSLFKSQKGSIVQAINKEEYFHNFLKKCNPNIAEQITIEKYLGDKKGAIIVTKYGRCLSRISVLKKLESISIQTAINKQEFWVNRAKDLRKDSENIDYSEANYLCNKNHVTLRCKKHNYTYTQRPSHHMANIQGCVHCMKQTVMYTKESVENHKEFLSNIQGYLYVIKLESQEESFYKVGIVSKERIKYRFESLKSLYNISFEHLSEGAITELFETEQKLLKDFENLKYTPKNKFTGYTECLTTNPIDEYYHWFNNN